MEITKLIENFVSAPWLEVITLVIGLASAVSALTKTPEKGSSLSKIYSVIDLLAINVGHAKEKPRAKKRKSVPAPTVKILGEDND